MKGPQFAPLPYGPGRTRRHHLFAPCRVHSWASVTGGRIASTAILMLLLSLPPGCGADGGATAAPTPSVEACATPVVAARPLLETDAAASSGGSRQPRSQNNPKWQPGSFRSRFRRASRQGRTLMSADAHYRRRRARLERSTTRRTGAPGITRQLSTSNGNSGFWRHGLRARTFLNDVWASGRTDVDEQWVNPPGQRAVANPWSLRRQTVARWWRHLWRKTALRTDF